MLRYISQSAFVFILTMAFFGALGLIAIGFGEIFSILRITERQDAIRFLASIVFTSLVIQIFRK